MVSLRLLQHYDNMNVIVSQAIVCSSALKGALHIGPHCPHAMQAQ